MRDRLSSIRRSHALLLNLFPRDYRHGYGEELQAVFALSLADAAKLGNLEIAKLLLRELAALPRAVLFEHVREWRRTRMTKKFGSALTETIALSVPFIVLVVFVFALDAIPNIPTRALEIIRLILLGILLAAFAVGIARGLPRWSLPFVGFMFAFANLFMTFGIIDPKWRGFSFPPFVSQAVRSFIQAGVYWVGILILVFLSILIAALVPAFRPFYRRLRNDWTLPAFFLYGTIPFAIVVTFDDYHHPGLYVSVSFLVLALGGWLYLRGDVPWKKFMFLFVGVNLAMAVATTGAALLIEDSLYASFSTWQEALVSSIVTWIWLAFFMLLPPLITLLPRPHEAASDPSPS